MIDKKKIQTYTVKRGQERIHIYLNSEKKVIVAKMEVMTLTGFKFFVGRSKCDPRDEFNVSYGTKLAVDRACGKYAQHELKLLSRKRESVVKDLFAMLVVHPQAKICGDEVDIGEPILLGDGIIPAVSIPQG